MKSPQAGGLEVLLQTMPAMPHPEAAFKTSCRRHERFLSRVQCSVSRGEFVLEAMPSDGTLQKR